MRVWLCGFCLGIATVACFPVLDRALLRLGLSLVAGGLLVSLRWQSALAAKLLPGLAVGLLWHWLWAVQQMEHRLPAHWQGQDVLVSGQVVGLPVITPRGQRFQLRLHPDANQLRGSLQLSTFDAADGLQVAAGQRWQLRVRLKQVHGHANPGVYDQESNLFRQGVIATGYVRDSADNVMTGVNYWSVSWWRGELWQKLTELLARVIPDGATQGMMLALILGERSQLSATHWNLFTATGTNHLFVISGLHVGLVALLCFRFGSVLARLPVLLPVAGRLQWTAPVYGCLLALVVTILYSLLAGWTLPTQRACVMVVVFLSSYLSKRRTDLWFRYLMALTLVLALDPLAPTQAGFWLSFTAVGVLLFCGLPPTGLVTADGTGWLRRLWQRMLRPQWMLFLGLSLPLIVWLGQLSLIAPLVNVLAIPVVGLLVVPLLLAGTVIAFGSETIAVLLLLTAHGLLSGLLALLTTMATLTADFNLMQWSAPDLWHGLFVLPGLLLLLLPWPLPYRWLALPLCLPLLVGHNQPIAAGQLRMDVLDVGQGLAVLIRTRNHGLLFDTGPGIESGWNAGEAIVLPVLRALQVRSLHYLVVSHGDTDHAGGAIPIAHHFPAATLLSGEPLPGLQTSLCRAGQSWIWDGAEFSILHPTTAMVDSNNNSCVLHIGFGEHGILLPGDIDAGVEKALARHYGRQLQASILLAAHHGSASSSSFPWLKMVNPQHVVFAAGYRNSFGHPAPTVVLRHYLLGAELHDTARSGMLSFVLERDVEQPLISGFRQQHPRYWAWSDNPLPCRYC